MRRDRPADYLASIGVPMRFRRWSTRREWEAMFGPWPHLTGAPIVYVHGRTGTGKTGFGVLWALEHGVAGRDVRWIAASDLTEGLKREFDGGRRQLHASLAAADALVIDGLFDGRGIVGDRPTAWQVEVLSLLIDDRWRNLRPLLVTSNWSSQMLGDIAPPLASRLVDPDGGDLLKLDGYDRRIAARKRVMGLAS